VPAPVQARSASPPVLIVPGGPATGAAQPALRRGQPTRPILPAKLQPSAIQPTTAARPQAPQPILTRYATPTAVQPHAGGVFAMPDRFTLRPRGSGQPLPENVQKKMESFFRTSFADVSVHVGTEAPSIGALAFTHGSDLYFAPGQYNPNSAQGQQLLGHELTHVVQQRAGRVRGPLGGGLAVVQDPSLEAEAQTMGLRAAAHQVPLQAKVSTTGQQKYSAPHGTPLIDGMPLPARMVTVQLSPSVRRRIVLYGPFTGSAESLAIQMARSPGYAIYRFGNANGMYLARPSDFGLANDDDQIPAHGGGTAAKPQGLSTMSHPYDQQKLFGKLWELPANSEIGDTAWEADGGPPGYHHSFYPTDSVTVAEFNDRIHRWDWLPAAPHNRPRRK